jgi:hypothetical protein
MWGACFGFGTRRALRFERIHERRRSRRAHNQVQLWRCHAHGLPGRRQDRPCARRRFRLRQPRLWMGLCHSRHRDAHVARDRLGWKSRGRQGRHGSHSIGRKDVGRNARRWAFYQRVLGCDCLWIMDRVHVPARSTRPRRRAAVPLNRVRIIASKPVHKNRKVRCAHRSAQVQTEHCNNSTRPRRGGMLQERPRRVGLPFWLLRISSVPSFFLVPSLVVY